MCVTEAEDGVIEHREDGRWFVPDDAELEPERLDGDAA